MVACLFANKQPNIKAEQPLLSPGGIEGVRKRVVVVVDSISRGIG